MSVQFGKCNFDGKPADLRDLDRVRPVLAPYGPDWEGIHCKKNVAILYRAFHTTGESISEAQPHVCTSGRVLTWDGRLDNRSDLIELLGREVASNVTDLALVSAAYERWGTDSFRKLIGDWALSIWDERTQSLVLAKDFVGTRHLYYLIERDRVTWCTILDPLILFAGHSFELEPEYLAGWLSVFPAPHLTPYSGVRAVPPSSFIRIANGGSTIRKYWDFDPTSRIRYRKDQEYEEHFRGVFGEAVRRRLRSHKPILAELSGGMDSSSIVCMADRVIAEGFRETARLDTVSYYDPSEPHWNELPYFTKVEAKRGRTGCHIEIGPNSMDYSRSVHSGFVVTPSSLNFSNGIDYQVAACITANGNRVVLSGFGGDEVLGGVPTAAPELADLAARAHLRTLARQLRLWALDRRRPWIHILWEVLRGFVPSPPRGILKHTKFPDWLNPNFVKQNRAAFEGYPRRIELFGPLPSFQENISTLDAMRRQLACCTLPVNPTYERRHPYLDRSLMEFLYSVPREQIVRPGQRRSLMRRALVGIVPDEILNRRRKAFASRTVLLAVSDQWQKLLGMSDGVLSTSTGTIDQNRLVAALPRSRQGDGDHLIALTRALAIECWLRSLKNRSLISLPGPGPSWWSSKTEMPF